MKVQFTQKEFDKLRAFQDRMAKEFGDTAYVGTDSATVLVNYSPKLRAMIRPLPQCNQFDFELHQLSCEDCKKREMFLCAPDETKYVCDKCLGNRKKVKSTACVVPQARADDLQEGFVPQ